MRTVTGGAVGVGGHLPYQRDVPSADGDQLNPR